MATCQKCGGFAGAWFGIVPPDNPCGCRIDIGVTSPTIAPEHLTDIWYRLAQLEAELKEIRKEGKG